MNSPDIIAALILGLAGSLHCAGMCGPIAIALPLSRVNLWGKAGRSLVYNGGRSSTYVLLGFLFGLFGQGLALAGFQQLLSVVIGALMIASVLIPVIFKRIKIYDQIYSLFLSKLFSLFRRQFSIDSYSSFLIIGLLNGLLPCGLVYVALAGAIATGNALSGALFMLIFGIGTIPMMMSISLAGSSFGAVFKNKLRKIIPYIVVLIGLLFILRGLDLGIKYISPKEDKLKLKTKTEQMIPEKQCH